MKNYLPSQKELFLLLCLQHHVLFGLFFGVIGKKLLAEDGEFFEPAIMKTFSINKES